MRDPMSWALPLYRAFGISVKVHILFFVIVLPLCLRQISELSGLVSWADVFLLSVVVLFVSVLLHEYGHCFAARWVDGDANEILIWPLGGLAFVDVPHHWRPNLITTLAGPAVNLAICIGITAAVLTAGFVPSLNPFANPYVAETRNVRDGLTYTSSITPRFFKEGTGEQYVGSVKETPDGGYVAADVTGQRLTRAVAPLWVVWSQRVFWVNWCLFLFNMLIPAYPMDCGRVLHAILWARTDHRRATVVSCYTGCVVGILMLCVSFFFNESVLVFFGVFVIWNCWRTLYMLEMGGEEGVFGYDFSAGYTSLDRDEPAPKKKRPGLIKRWLQQRAARRLQREIQQREEDERRMDALLEKIQQSGKASLTDEEKRFLERVSNRYRNRS
jgi:Zn-dependent protease